MNFSYGEERVRNKGSFISCGRSGRGVGKQQVIKASKNQDRVMGAVEKANPCPTLYCIV